jgi:hypothetical protein
VLFIESVRPPNPPKPLSIPQEMITVVVGPDGSQQKFVIHKSIISHYSPFFAAVFNGRFVEGDTLSMRLADGEGKIFGLLVHWIYKQEIEGGYDTELIAAVKLWYWQTDS